MSLDRYAPFGAFGLVDVAAEDAGALHFVEVHPQLVTGHVASPIARRAAACEVREDLLHVATAAKHLPASVHLGVGLLYQRRPREVGAELRLASHWGAVPGHRQRVVDVDELPLAVLVKTEDEDSEAGIRVLHVAEHICDQLGFHRNGLQGCHHVEVLCATLVDSATVRLHGACCEVDRRVRATQCGFHEALPPAGPFDCR
mmetsp:Transcript_115923/g.328031  ORF Transcript_115923/g.328031 Transcript_115923/m.328031 type:complete len:201 (-) Transcript_115923:116-718(-)